MKTSRVHANLHYGLLIRIEFIRVIKERFSRFENLKCVAVVYNSKLEHHNTLYLVFSASFGGDIL